MKTKWQYLRYGLCQWELRQSQFTQKDEYQWYWTIRKWIMFPIWLVKINTFLRIAIERGIKE